MTETPQVLGLIAGSRSLPIQLARQAKKMGVPRIVAVAFHGETDSQIDNAADEVIWLKVGQLTKMIRAFQERDVKQCVMAGQIAPKNLWEVRPDLRALTILMRIKEKNAHTLFGALADELHREGIELIEATPWLRPLMPGAGLHIGRPATPEETDDVAFGYRIAKEITRLEIGQSVVVKRGMVLAVEAFEGTDRCLARGGELAGSDGGAVAVKVARQNHDMRFDIPCVGARTVATCAEHRIAVLAFEAGKTLLLEEDEVKSVAERHAIAVTAVG